MTAAAARRLWVSLETVHDVVFFAPQVRQAGLDLGLRGYWMTYFAFRAAPLGTVDAGVVVATFANFHPDMVAKAIPDAWSRTSPAACLAARSRVSVEALLTIGASADAFGRAAALLAPALAGADLTGRPLAAANASLPRPDDPLAALWQLAATLREHRGDGHVAALVAAGISGLEGHLLQVGAGRFSATTIRAARGWSEPEWDAAAARLRSRGLLDSDQALTGAGRSLLAGIEQRTDEIAWTGALAPLGADGADEVCALLSDAVSAVRRSGLLPADNPAGVPLA